MARGDTTLSGARDHAEDFLDREQGIAHFKGVPGRNNRTAAAEAAE